MTIAPKLPSSQAPKPAGKCWTAPLLSLLLGLASGCPNDTDEGVGGDTGFECDECSDCNSQQKYLSCLCRVGTEWTNEADCPAACGTTVTLASDCVAVCNEVFGQDNWDAFDLRPEIPCDGVDVDENCSNWNPASEVSLVSGVYHVDETFIDRLVADPDALSACDDAYFDGGLSSFEVKRASSGELLYELGLRNGDVVRKLNGTTIQSYTDVITVFASEWLSDGETLWYLQVNRGGTIVTLRYEVD